MSMYSGIASLPHSLCLDIKILYNGEEWKRGATQAGTNDMKKHWIFAERELDNSSRELAAFCVII